MYGLALKGLMRSIFLTTGEHRIRHQFGMIKTSTRAHFQDKNMLLTNPFSARSYIIVELGGLSELSSGMSRIWLRGDIGSDCRSPLTKHVYSLRKQYMYTISHVEQHWTLYIATQKFGGTVVARTIWRILSACADPLRHL